LIGPTRLVLGKVIRSENQLLYWAQINNNLESEPTPTPKDCAFGTFVKIEPITGGDIRHVGLIVDTILIDRDLLRAGPRLAVDQQSLQTFFPDFVDERVKVVRIIVIGYFDKNNKPHHSFPETTPNLSDDVVKMEQKEIEEFHIINKDYKVGYFSQIIQLPRPIFVVPLILNVIPKLMSFFPENKIPILKLMKNNLEYKLKLGDGFLG